MVPPIRYGVLLYKQLIRPVVNWPCPIWRSAAHTLCQEAVGASILMSSHGHRCTLVHWQKANSRGFGTFIFGRPHQSSYRVLRLKFNWNGEAPILATRQIRWPSVDQGHLKRKLSVTEISMSIEADRETVAKSAQRIVPSAVQLHTFRLPLRWFFFPRDFS